MTDWALLIPVKKNIKIYRGMDNVFTWQFWEDKDAGVKADFTGFTVTAKCRQDMDDDSDIIFDFTFANDLPNGLICAQCLRAVSTVLEDDRGYWSLFVIDSLGLGRPWYYGRVDIRDMPTTEKV
jgi:hypothetical protein